MGKLPEPYVTRRQTQWIGQIPATRSDPNGRNGQPSGHASGNALGHRWSEHCDERVVLGAFRVAATTTRNRLSHVALSCPDLISQRFALGSLLSREGTAKEAPIAYQKQRSGIKAHRSLARQAGASGLTSFQ